MCSVEMADAVVLAEAGSTAGLVAEGENDGVWEKVVGQEVLPAGTVQTAFTAGGSVCFAMFDLNELFKALPEMVDAALWHGEGGKEWKRSKQPFPLLGGVVTGDTGLWLLGSTCDVGYNVLFDVPQLNLWHSPDGENWSKIEGLPPVSGRTGLGATWHDGALWVAGGQDSTERRGDRECYSDVWRYRPEAGWDCVQETAAWGPSARHALVSYRGALWLFSGIAEPEAVSSGHLYAGRPIELNHSRKVWRSANGIDWDLLTDGLPWKVMRKTEVIVDGDRLFATGRYTREIWSSDDGVHWRRLTEELPVKGVWDKAMVAYEGYLYVMLHHGQSRAPNEIWRLRIAD